MPLLNPYPGDPSRYNPNAGGVDIRPILQVVNTWLKTRQFKGKKREEEAKGTRDQQLVDFILGGGKGEMPSRESALPQAPESMMGKLAEFIGGGSPKVKTPVTGLEQLLLKEKMKPEKRYTVGKSLVTGKGEELYKAPEKKKTHVLGQGQNLYDEEGKVIARGEKRQSKPIVVGQGQVVINESGQVIARGQGKDKGFTLKPGEVRYDKKGQQIAKGPKKDDSSWMVFGDKAETAMQVKKEEKGWYIAHGWKEAKESGDVNKLKKDLRDDVQATIKKIDSLNAGEKVLDLAGMTVGRGKAIENEMAHLKEVSERYVELGGNIKDLGIEGMGKPTDKITGKAPDSTVNDFINKHKVK